MRRPRDAFALATALLAGLWLIAPDPPHIVPAEASAHEGREVHVDGVVLAAQAWDGGGRMHLGHDGHALEVRVEGPLPELGAWVQATGDLRRDGDLVLWASTWRPAAAPDVAVVPLATLAAVPDEWTAQRITTRGEMEDTALRDGAIRVSLGEGPRLAGHVQVEGALVYEPRCLCYVLHIDEIRPWIR